MSGQTIATCGGYEMVEVGPRIYFIDRGTGGYAIALFVLGLLTVIASVNGIVQLGMGNLMAGLIIGAVGAVFGAVFALVLRARRARLALRWDQNPTIAFIDRETGSAHDPAGQALAPLTHVAFAPVFQIASSSQALAMKLPRGEIVIARGSPFSGSIDDFTDALRARGFRA
jgi:hypothetical protein